MSTFLLLGLIVLYAFCLQIYYATQIDVTREILDEITIESHNEESLNYFDEELTINESLDNEGGNNDTDAIVDLDQLTIVQTVDGMLHALDSSSRLVWKVNTGGPLSSSHRLIDDRPYSLIPETSGTILVHTPEGVKRSTISTKMLVDRTPFMSERDGLFFVGHKNSRIFGIDISTGEVVSDTGALKDTQAKPKMPRTTELSNEVKSSPKASLWIGRIDYVLRAFDSESGVESFNLTSAEVIPLFVKQTELGDDMPAMNSVFSKMMSSYYPGSIDFKSDVHSSLPMLSTANGELFSSRFTEKSYNRIPLGSTAVSSYRINRCPSLDPIATEGESIIQLPTPLVIPNRLVPHLALPSPPSVGNEVDTHKPTELDLSSLAVHSVVIKSHENSGGLYAVELTDLFAQSSTHSALANALNLQLVSATTPETSVEDVTEEVDMQPSLVVTTERKAHRPYRTSNKLRRLLYSSRTISKDKVGGIKDRRKRPFGGKQRRQATEFTGPVLPPPSYEDMTHFDDTSEDSLRHSRQHLCATSVDQSLQLGLPLCSVEAWIQRLQINDEQNLYSLLPLESDDRTLDSSSTPNVVQSSSRLPLSYPNFLTDFTVAEPTKVEPTKINESANESIPTLVVSHHDPEDRYSSNGSTFNFRAEIAMIVIAVILCLSVIAIAVVMVTRAISRKGATETNIADVVAAIENGAPALPEPEQQISLSEEVLGYGSHGTIVFKGKLEGRPVAVKRMLSHFHRSVEREIALLVQSDGHPNVVRYFLREQRGDFVYLALQLCVMSLREFVTKLLHSQNTKTTIGGTDSIVCDEVRSALLQIALGLNHLHNQRIVHRDIKPHNILCAEPDIVQRRSEKDVMLDGNNATLVIDSVSRLGNYVLKISDMGLSKQLASHEDSFPTVSMSLPSQRQSVTRSATASTSSSSGSASAVGNVEAGPVGTIGWQAPELMNLRLQKQMGEGNGEILDTTEDDELEVPETPSTSSIGSEERALSTKTRKTQYVDVFSLGCVYHYILVPGVHPFGQWFERETNIISGKADLSRIEAIPDALDLVRRMIQLCPEKRPTSAEVCKHPFFWPTPRRLEFLVELSDRLEQEPVNSAVMLDMESAASDILGIWWSRRLDVSLLEDVSKFRKYDETSVRELLRLIRNKRHHYNDLPELAKAAVGTLPCEFCVYFESRFPKLLMHCVRVACVHLSTDPHLAPFCAPIVAMFPCVSENVAGKEGVHEASESHSCGNTASSSSSFSLSEGCVTSSLYDAVSEDTSSLSVIVWQKSNLAAAYQCRGWWQDGRAWVNQTPRKRAPQFQKHIAEPKYRTQLCSHWESNNAAGCPMKNKGKCIFAHGPAELRLRELRRDRNNKILFPDALASAKDVLKKRSET